jgi:hypothetical protein
VLRGDYGPERLEKLQRHEKRHSFVPKDKSLQNDEKTEELIREESQPS